MNSILKKLVPGLFVVALAGLAGCASTDPKYTYVPYMPDEAGPFNVLVMPPEDPARSMAVAYHVLNEDAKPVVFYDTVSRDGDAESYAHQATGETRMIPGLYDERLIQGVVLEGLEPDTTYYFVAGDPETGVSEEYSFRTFPATGPYRLAIGGDMNRTPLAGELLAQVGASDADAFIVGGDIAYVNGDLTFANKWDIYFDIVEENLRAPDGRLIPFWAGLGNHETNGDMRGVTDNHGLIAPFFVHYFWPQGEGAIFARTLGDDEALLLFLDSGHLTPHAEQNAFIEEQLAAADAYPFTFAIYHVPLYPTHRAYDGGGSVAGREEWLPLFDKYRLTAGFEHHDHVFKRTVPLRNGEKAEGGTVYLGDGSMGVDTRTGEERWYHAAWGNTPHFWLIDIDKTETRARAIDREGTVFDETTLAPRTATATP